MVFPDYHFFAERRLLHHTIDEKRVKNLDDCELFCYLTDECVSLNYKKDPENDKTGYNCELNNATHLKYDSDFTTDAKFYYRGSKVNYKSIFQKYRLGMIQKQLWMFMQILVHSIIRCLVSSFTHTLYLSLVISFHCFVSFRSLVTRITTAKLTQLASLDLHSRYIDACVLLDSREDIVKRYEFKSTLEINVY